jgi:hypothetical protein
MRIAKQVWAVIEWIGLTEHGGLQLEEEDGTCKDHQMCALFNASLLSELDANTYAHTVLGYFMLLIGLEGYQTNEPPELIQV